MSRFLFVFLAAVMLAQSIAAFAPMSPTPVIRLDDLAPRLWARCGRSGSPERTAGFFN